LVVVRLDRLTRSVKHLLEVIEMLEAKKAHFRSLRYPIDTSTPQGMFSLQVLGAVAQLERSLISERTKAGIKAAKARGRKPGNPGMRERRPEAIRKITVAREKVYIDELIAGADRWMPTVWRMRPQHPWGMLSACSPTADKLGPWLRCAARSASSSHSTWRTLPSSALLRVGTRRTAP
jgi:hypothetical protein